jgi:hypothetical protein
VQLEQVTSSVHAPPGIRGRVMNRLLRTGLRTVTAGMVAFPLGWLFPLVGSLGSAFKIHGMASENPDGGQEYSYSGASGILRERRVPPRGARATSNEPPR